MLVEDDRAVRESLTWMLDSSGMRVEPFSTPQKLLEGIDKAQRGCLLLDLHLPEMNGLELYDRLTSAGCHLPFVIMTAFSEVSNAIKAMRLGAVDFLQKPLDRDTLVDRIRTALELDKKQESYRLSQERLQARLDTLTKRERQVLKLVLDGRLTKQIARELGVTSKTVEAHRCNIMKKMCVDNVVQLVRLTAEHRPPSGWHVVPDVGVYELECGSMKPK